MGRCDSIELFDLAVEIAEMNYTHLTREERYQIYALKKAGHKQSEIACLLNRSGSTISRELARNQGCRGYRPKQVHETSKSRRAINARKVAEDIRRFAQVMLLQQWNPEQISGHADIIPETVYQRVYADKQSGGLLWNNLRCQKKRRKRYGKMERRGQIPNRLFIEDRPAIVEKRKRIGDWEADTIIGKNHKQAIVSIVERKTGLTLIRKVERKTAQAVSMAMIGLLKPFQSNVYTITSDNGKEFAGHEEVANKLQADLYFAHLGSEVQMRTRMG